MRPARFERAASRVGVWESGGAEALRGKGFGRRVGRLTTILTTFRVFIRNFDTLGGAFFGDMNVHAEDHFFIRVAEPDHGLVHINASIPEHGAVGVAEIVRAEADRMTGGTGEGEKVAVPRALKSDSRHNGTGGGRGDEAGNAV